MIEFLNEEVRKEFHLLPVDRQKEFLDLGVAVARKGQVVRILCVERFGANQSEIAISIYEKFDKAT